VQAWVAAVVVACMSLPFQATLEEHSKTNTQRLLALRVGFIQKFHKA
jgi:hypothetical protein